MFVGGEVTVASVSLVGGRSDFKPVCGLIRISGLVPSW